MRWRGIKLDAPHHLNGMPVSRPEIPIHGHSTAGLRSWWSFKRLGATPESGHWGKRYVADAPIPAAYRYSIDSRFAVGKVAETIAQASSA